MATLFSSRRTHRRHVQLIQPDVSLFNFDPVEIWRYRHLIPLLVRRDIIAEYSNTALGPLWFVIHPLMQSVVFAVVFGSLARISTDGTSPFLFYNASLVLWLYFSQCSTFISQVFITNAGLFQKLYFPRLIVPVAIATFRMITLLVNYSIFVVMLLIFLWRGAAVNPNWWILVTPLLFFQVAAIAFGLGTLASAFTLRSRDIVQAFGYFISMGMYATPIIYPLSSVPESYRILYYANPLTAPVELFRYAYLGAGAPDLRLWAANACVTAMILIAGVIVFNYCQRKVVDTI